MGMAGKRHSTFPGWMPGLYRKVGKRITTFYTIAAGRYVGLGNDIAEARRALVALGHDEPSGAGTIAAMLDDEIDRREKRVARGKLAPRTLEDNRAEAVNLKKAFGRMRPQDLRKAHVYDYLHRYRGAEAPVRANREIALLQAAFRPLIAAEVLAANPCVDVERNEETPRDRMVSREELEAFLAFARANGHIKSEAPEAQWAREHQDAGARIANALELSFLTTKAQGEILKLTRGRLKAEGIEWPGRKRGAPTLTEWTPALRACVDRCLAMPAESRGQAISPTFVVFTRDGQPYTSRGFRAIVGRIMKAWGDAGNARFTFHDAGRARGITKLREDGRDAAEVSGHREERTVARIYDRRTFRKARAVE